MASKYLDYDGLSYLWGKIKTYVSNAIKVTGVKGSAESSYRTGDVNITAANIGLESKTAASGGTAVSLVTTGEKYAWNNKSDLALGTTSTTAAAGDHTHGHITNAGEITTSSPIGSGDSFIIRSHIDGKITQSNLSFSSGTTRYLREDGSWQTPAGGSGEANQNAFSNVKVGTTTIAADTTTDTLELAAGTGITLTPDATNDKVTIAASLTRVQYDDIPVKSLPTGSTAQNMGSFVIESPGLWHIDVVAQFASNATGLRCLQVAKTSGNATYGIIANDIRTANSGAVTTCRVSVTMATTSANETIYINGYQNSGSARNVSMRAHIIGMKT